MVSLYFHVPFCKKKCGYCQFYSIPYTQSNVKKYVKAIKEEWKRKKHLLTNKKVVSIYLGGGTPSLLPQDALFEIIPSGVQAKDDIEITLEANPRDVTLPYAKAWKAIGINRISLGVQSFCNRHLQTLGRQHTQKHALDAIEMIDHAGIKNISVDLMYDIPEQSLKSFKDTLDTLSSLPISHVSLYNLTLEPSTPFYEKRASLKKRMPSPNLSLKLLKMALEDLEKMGFKRYEISAFCKRDRISKHNIGYWTNRPFLGFGPAAFSYMDGGRFQNVPDLEVYCQTLFQGNTPIEYSETLNQKRHKRERLMLHLRLIEGVNLKDFAPLDDATMDILQEKASQGLLDLHFPYCKLTEKGYLFYDTVAEALVY